MNFLAETINGYWVHDLGEFVPFLQFSEKIGVRWYGLAYVLGFVLGAWLLRRYSLRGRSTVPAERVPDLIIALVIGVFLGGRLGYFLLYEPHKVVSDPLSFFRVWDGGMASHGGFVGVAVAMAWFARSNRLSFLQVSDVVVSAAPVGLFLGRIANFINGELWGKIATVPWAVIFPRSEDFPPAPRHPSQLYQAVLEGALLFAWLQLRFWRSDVVKTQPGRLAGEFLVGYAIARVIGELFREPDRGVSLLFGLSRGTFYSFFIFLTGAILIVLARRRKTPDAS
jgi:phosphatidylglycerol---prolipoprotein diacylglyceryl transferase